MNDLIKEYNEKKERLSKYLEERDLEGAVFTRRSNFSWLTCGGRNKIVDCLDDGGATLLFHKGKLYLFTTNIEMERMKDEEINDLNLIDCIPYMWFKADEFQKRIAEIVDLTKIRQDSRILKGVDFLDDEFNKIKLCLTGPEKTRYKELGRVSTKCMTETCRDIKKGMTEFRVQAILSDHLISEGITPWIILIGSDERLFNYRHPVPTGKEIKNYVMVVVGAMKWGLIASITRLVYFGKPPDEILKARDIITRVDANMILSSRPGIRYSLVINNEIKESKEHGLETEWHNHHQGGPGGYEGRFFLVTPETRDMIEKNHAIAWNPSMRGFKSEDTFIVGEDKNLIITRDESWPALEVNMENGKILRSDILIK